MMEKRKRVALLVAEPDKADQKQIMNGLFVKLVEKDMDVCVFAMHLMYQNTSEREIGDTKIFSLIPYESFDAFVVLADTIQTPGVLEQLESELKTYFKGPVLFVDKKTNEFPYIHMDNHGLTKKMISHLIEKHGYTDIAYLTGKMRNDHAKARLLGYQECMAEHGISVRENRVYEGDFWYTSGESMVDKLMRSANGLPQAIACANNCMAIGVATAFERYGKKVPEDVAVVGFDYSLEGLLSPAPVTAIYMPYLQLGINAALTILAMMDGREIPKFELDGELFVGHSCGCQENIDYKDVLARDHWESVNASVGFDARYNTMLEDLMGQNKLKDFYNLVSSYAYQIPGIDSFHLCLNPYWADEEKLIDFDNDWSNYAEEMLWAVKYEANSEDNADSVSMNRLFPTQQILPEMDEERDQAKVFFISPIYFDDKTFGYSVLCCSKEPQRENNVYPRWQANVMRGLECVRKTIMAEQAKKQLFSSAYTDQRTGLNNYIGLMRQAKALVEEQVTLHILAIDVKGLAIINELHGRDEGNQLIQKLAEYVKACRSASYCCCLGNDEFLMLSEQQHSIEKMQAELLEKIEQGNKSSEKYQMDIHMGFVSGEVSNEAEFEHLISDAVVQKNGNKVQMQRQQNVVTYTEEERKVMSVVQEMLNNNLFTYHFQPIISAKTGDIYSYEALMRSDTEIRVSPLDILKYAQALSRLEDVERYTFVNIISYIQGNSDLFENKKVFINSIPGISLSDMDEQYVMDSMKASNGQIVVELTEQAELDDGALAALKEKYAQVGVEMAVDDYGTGYSNVTNLLRYMPRYVKIDRMLLSHIEESPQKQHFVNEIIEFAHNNNIMALAEGVETAEELETVIQLGADLIQGYYVAKPASEVMQTIPVKLKREIHQINLQREYNRNQSIYVAGREFRISLAKLMTDAYECIVIPTENATYRDLSIVGMRSNNYGIVIEIADGYKGRLQLENVCLAGKRGIPCIRIGEDCDVTLVLTGDNEFKSGGICVPENSKLTVEGAGNLTLNCNFEGYYGIGNDMDKKHGEIVFVQEGAVEVTGNGTTGVAVGSGKGGKLRINSGKLIVNQTGKRGVAIGSIQGDTDIEIKACDVFIDSSVYEGVAIGVMEGHMKLVTQHMAINAKLSGTNLVGVGAVTGVDNNIVIKNGSVILSIRGLKACGIGSFSGTNEIYVEHAGIGIKASADIPIMLGDENKKSKLDLNSAEINMSAETENKMIFGVEENETHLRIGNLVFNQNGEVVQLI